MTEEAKYVHRTDNGALVIEWRLAKEEVARIVPKDTCADLDEIGRTACELFEVVDGMGYLDVARINTVTVVYFSYANTSFQHLSHSADAYSSADGEMWNVGTRIYASGKDTRGLKQFKSRFEAIWHAYEHCFYMTPVKA